MMWTRSVDRLAVSAVGLLSVMTAVALAGASPALAARADNIPPPVVESPTLPRVALSPRVLEMASEYRAYMRHAAAVKTHFENGQAIESSLADVEAYEPQQLIRGAVAYGAVIALQDPAFVAGVRVYAGNSAIRRDFADRIIADPNYITGMPGAATAAKVADSHSPIGSCIGNPTAAGRGTLDGNGTAIVRLQNSGAEKTPTIFS